MTQRARTTAARRMSALLAVLRPAFAAAIVMATGLCARAEAPKPPSSQHLSQYGHASWRVQDGQLSSPNGIAQTPDGYLWLATDTGLLRFDGARFDLPDNLRKVPLPWPQIYAVHVDAGGDLWIGAGIQVLQVKGDQVVNYAATGPVARFADARAGGVWIVTTRSSEPTLCRLAMGKRDCVPASEMPLTDGAALEAGPGGDLWIGGSRGICHWSPGKAASCHLRDVLRSTAGLTGVNAILTTRDGTRWVGIDKRGLGLGQFSDGRWKGFAAPGLDGSSVAVSALMEDRAGALWIGTSNQGVFRLQAGRAEHFGRADGLTSDTVADGGLFQDREGTVWVLTTLGLDAFRRLPVSVFSVREGLPADEVESVLPARDGTVWLGNESPSTIVGDAPGRPPDPALFRGRQVTSLLQDHAGRLWMGLDDTLNLYEHGRLKPIPGPDGGPMGAVERIIEDRDDDVWLMPVGMPHRLLRIHEDGAVERVDGAGAIPANIDIRALAPDARGGILLGLGSGALGHFHAGRLEMIPPDGSSPPAVFGLLGRADGTILATTPHGLLVQRGTWRGLLDAERGMPCQLLRSVVQDRRGNLWLHGDCGIVHIEAAEFERWLASPASAIQARLFDVTDGVHSGTSSFMPHSALAPDGRVWFATGKVALVIDPAEVAAPHPPPAVLIDSMAVDRREVRLERSPALPTPARDLEIRYTATSFVAPQKIRFRYRLEGRDRDWTDAGTRRQAFYNDLPPGHYRFRVIACNADGVWNGSGATQDFEIPPLFYQTTWFLVLCLAGAALALYGLHLFRLRRIAARLSDRLAAKHAEREDIARELHDTLLQSTQSLILRFHSATKRLPPGDPAREDLMRALDRADEVVEEGRDRVLGLRASGQGLADLSEALAATGRELARDTGISFRTFVEGDRRPLQPKVRDEACRIGCEALVNAFRHGQARAIEVHLSYGRAEMRMSIRDDGVGIDTNAGHGGERPGHWGLRGMRERAQQIGARFDLTTRPGEGTEIDVRIPAQAAYATAAPRWRWRWRWLSALIPTGQER